MQALHKVLCQLVIDQARQLRPKCAALRTQLAKPCPSWKNGDYETLALLMELSCSTVKRLFGRPGYCLPAQFNATNRRKIAHFLGYRNWAEVEQACLARFVGQSLQGWSVQ
jgi:hypothetical protein